MSKPTPGPWTVVRRRDGMAIQPIGLVAFGGMADERARANLALAAAAPELLDLLQKHLDWYDGKLLSCSENEFIDATRAVIEKAGGEP